MSDRLSQYFGQDQVFIDIDMMVPGEHFGQKIAKTIRIADVVLVLIGKNWLEVKNEKGKRRLDERYDYVRREIEASWKHKLHVVPVLVDGAEIPPSRQLPVILKRLSTRQAIRLRHESFGTDVTKLIEVIEKKTCLTQYKQSEEEDEEPIVDDDSPSQEKPSSLKISSVGHVEEIEDVANILEVSENTLFPVDGINLGVTTVRELAKLGKRATYIDKDTKEPYQYYKINGVDFWYEGNVADHIYLARGLDKIPQEWKDLGFGWNLSYDQWVRVLKRLACKLDIVQPPKLAIYDGKNSFSAKIRAEKYENIPIEIELNFNYSAGTTTDAQGTLYAIRMRRVAPLEDEEENFDDE